MTSRTNTKQVTFRQPFWVSGFDCPQPAGTYTVDTDEELIEALSFLAWRRVRTTVHLVRGGTTEFFPVDAGELDEALRRDAERTA